MADKKPEYRIIRRTRDGQWEMLEVEGHYVFVRYENDEPSIVNTPAGNMVQTIYPDLAERILNDLDRFGYDFHSPESILAWHFTMIDNFAEMDHARVEAILDQSFL